MDSSLPGPSPEAAITAKGAPSSRIKKHEVVGSWEDEDLSSDSDAGDAPENAEGPPPSSSSAPPPTPSSPTAASDLQEWNALAGFGSPSSMPSPASPRDPNAASLRPEKTDAVARRMIAGALGLKAPKQTEEQKAYQKAIREQEKQRRDRDRAAERAREEEAERARAAIWND